MRNVAEGRFFLYVWKESITFWLEDNPHRVKV
jgi:hypothetical protein